jgi:hypothetical protein
MHISGETVAMLANAVRSLDDAKLGADCKLYARDEKGGLFTPIIVSDDEEPDRAMTVQDLRDLLAPFAAWFT